MKFRLPVFLHLLKDEDDFSAAVLECGAGSTQLLAPSSPTCLQLRFLAGFPSVRCSRTFSWITTTVKGLHVHLFLLNCIRLHKATS